MIRQSPTWLFLKPFLSFGGPSFSHLFLQSSLLKSSHFHSLLVTPTLRCSSIIRNIFFLLFVNCPRILGETAFPVSLPAIFYINDSFSLTKCHLSLFTLLCSKTTDLLFTILMFEYRHIHWPWWFSKLICDVALGQKCEAPSEDKLSTQSKFI